MEENIEIEKRIINLMLKHLDIIQDIVNKNITIDFFNERYQHLVHSIFHVFGMSNCARLLTQEHYKRIILEEGGEGNISIPLEVYYECEFVKPATNSKDDFDFLINGLINQYIHKGLAKSLNRYNSNVSKIGMIGAVKQYSEELNSLVSLTEFKKSAFMFLPDKKEEYIKNIIQRRDNPDEAIKCNIPEVDEAMNVGFKSGHTTVVVAQAGGYKTTFMLSIALGIYKRNNCPILFAPLEMDWEDFYHRIVSNITGVSYSKILNPPELTDVEIKTITDAKAWAMDKFAIIDIDEQMSVSVLKQEIEKRIQYFQPKVVVIDYLALLKLSSKNVMRHDLELGELAKYLKFLGKKHGFHILTAAQLGRQDIKRLRDQPDAILDTTSIKDSQEISANAEFIFALVRIDNEPDRVSFQVIKSRYGSSGYKKELRVNADICQVMSNDLTVNISSISNEDNVDHFDLEMNVNPEQIVSEMSDSGHELFKGFNYTVEDLDTI